MFAYNPTVVTIMLGMNDGRYRPFDQQIFDEYATGYKHIIQVLKRQLPRVRITAIQPSPFDDVTRPPTMELGYNAVLVRYGEFVKQLAADEKLAVADLNTSVVAALSKAKATDADGSAKIVPDRVHPGPGGHLLMAEALLKSWNAPDVVTDVELDASRKEPVRQVNTVVSDLRTGKGLSWTQTDEALPMPIDMSDRVMALAVNSSDIVEALNRQPLKVRGLAAGKYVLKIDGEPVGSFSADQLAASINLATLPTPMAQQAAEVHALTLRHNNLHYARWRQIQVPMEKVSSTNVLKALGAIDELEQEVIREQRLTVQPKPRRFELTLE